MKLIQIILVILFFFSSDMAHALKPVVDFKLIRINLLNARRALAEQVLHGARQVEELQRLAQQIRQIDDYLDRFGDPKKVELTTFNEAVSFLKELGFNKTSEDITRDIKGDEVFRKEAGSPYKTLTPEILFEGKTVARRDTEVFRPEIAARRSFDHYREVRTQTLQNRKRIMAEIETSLKQLKTASTASEVAKLNTLIRAQENQLQANDREIEFAAHEVMTRYFQNLVEEQIETKARVQQEREAIRHSLEKDLQTWSLPTKTLRFIRKR